MRKLRLKRFVTLQLAVGLAAAVAVGMPAKAAYSASTGTQVLKGAAIGFAVTKFAGPLDKFINTVTLKHGMKTGLSTKVVPVLSVGEKGYIGGAQVSGPSSEVKRVKAVFQYEKNFSNNNYRAKILLPSGSLNPIKLDRIQKVGVTALIDVALAGRQRYQTVGTGVKAGDAIRGGAVLVAIKNVGDTVNKGLNAITFNRGTVNKVVPWGSFGEKAYLGGAQVSASTTTINKVNAVWQYEDLFSGGQFRVKVLVPTTSSNPLKMKRVDGAGITAIVDMALSQQRNTAQYRPNRPNRAINTRANRVLDTRTINPGPVYRPDARSSNGRYVAPDRKDNGKHKGWYKGQRNGRKHPWVDAKWRAKLATLDERDRDSFVDWLDRRSDRSLANFDRLYREFCKR